MSKDERRQSLLDAARDLFSEKGYHDTTVDDITKAANVAKGTFYLYFDEKREIYHEVIRGFLDLIKEIGNIAESPMTSPLEFFVRAHQGATRLLEVLAQNRQLARMAYRESMGLDPKLAEMLQGFYREIASLEAKNVQAAIDLGIIRPCHTLLVAYMHLGMIERAMMELLEHPDDFPPLVDVVNELLRINFEGLRGPFAPPWSVMVGQAVPPAVTGDGSTS